MTPTYWTLTVEVAVAAGPVPLIRSLMTSCLGGGPEGGTTLGLVLRAAGSGVVLVLVELVVVALLLAGVMAAAVVEPWEGASWTPGAAELEPQADTATATANRAHVSV